MPTPWAEKERATKLLELMRIACQEDKGRTLLATPWFGMRRSDFPGEWKANISKLGGLLHRIKHYAGLPQFSIEIVDVRQPRQVEAPVQRPAIDFVEAHNGQLVFQIAHFGVEEGVVAQCVLGMCAAVVVGRRKQAAYREGVHAQELSRQELELATALSIVLGFGIITVNASASTHSFEEINGYSATTYRAELMEGSLPTEDLCFLFAVAMVLRNKKFDGGAVAKLHPNQAAEVEYWVSKLKDGRDDLLKELQVEDTQEERPLPEIDQLSEEEVTQFERSDYEFAHPYFDSQARIIKRRRVISFAFAGFVLSIVPAVAFLARFGDDIPLFAIIGAAVLGGFCGFFRSRQLCELCWARVRPEDDNCRGCGAEFVESQAPLAEMVDEFEEGDSEEDASIDEEGYDESDPLVLAALAAGEHDDFGEHGAV